MFPSFRMYSTFWHGLGDGKGCAIYDDFRDSHMKPSEFINFIDYNIHPMNLKGGSIMYRFSHIIITSVQNPKRIYGGMYDDEPRKQWLRRMSIIELSINEEQTDSSSKGCMGSDSVLPI